jgi:hypothetical protein
MLEYLQNNAPDPRAAEGRPLPHPAGGLRHIRVTVLIRDQYQQGRSATNIGNCADLLLLMPYIAIH